MKDPDILRTLIAKDHRYTIEACLFVLEAFQYTRNKIKESRHVTGQELLEGIKELGLAHYGPLTKLVFEHWGVKTTMDFGNIVFNMVNSELLTKTDSDSFDDFPNGYDFDDVFLQNYKFNFENQ